MWNLKYDTNELIYEIETDSWTKSTDYSCRGGKVKEGWIGSLGIADINYNMWSGLRTRSKTV